VARAPEFTIEVPAQKAAALSEAPLQDKRVQVGIRPEALTLSSTRDATHPIGGRIYAVQPLGDVEIVDVRVGEDRILVRTELGTINNEDMDAPVFLGYKPEKLHFFDAGTGQAVY
jgi:ABC-type sugar transport system ATPase subunit